MRREGAQVKAAEAGRRGSVGHVEVFRMDGVGTSIVGRPRHLSADLTWTDAPGRPTPSSGKSRFADDIRGERKPATALVVT